MKIWELQSGQTLTYTYYGETYTSTFKYYRNLEVRTKEATYLVFTELHCLSVGSDGQAVAYDDYENYITDFHLAPIVTEGEQSPLQAAQDKGENLFMRYLFLQPLPVLDGTHTPATAEFWQAFIGPFKLVKPEIRAQLLRVVNLNKYQRAALNEVLHETY